MVTSGHQISMGCEIEDRRAEARPNDKHMVQRSSESTAKGTGEGEDTFQLEYNDLTDVMFVDLAPLCEGSRICVIDVGDQVGFPGQIQVRVDLEQQTLHGLTIQNYSGFRRKLIWRYRMWSIQAALRFLISSLIAGLNIDQRNHPRPAIPC
jgi:hypothetical protein